MVREHKQNTEESNLYLSLVNSAYDGIALGCEGRIIIANKSFAKIFGYNSNTELVNKEIIELASNDDILKVCRVFQIT